MTRLRHKMLRKPSKLRRAKRDFLGICGVSDCCYSAVDRIGICKNAWSSSTGHLIDTTKTLWAMK